MSSGESHVSIPKEITELAMEALSDHNDGYMKEGCRKRLKEIRDYIDRVLALGTSRVRQERDDEIDRRSGGLSSR